MTQSQRADHKSTVLTLELSSRDDNLSTLSVSISNAVAHQADTAGNLANLLDLVGAHKVGGVRQHHLALGNLCEAGKGM